MRTTLHFYGRLQSVERLHRVRRDVIEIWRGVEEDPLSVLEDYRRRWNV